MLPKRSYYTYIDRWENARGRSASTACDISPQAIFPNGHQARPLIRYIYSKFDHWPLLNNK